MAVWFCGGRVRVFISDDGQHARVSEIVSTEGVMGGQPRIAERRISVLQIVEWVHEEGLDTETVAAEFDLEMADIYRALTYYYDNIDEMSEWRRRREQRIADSREEQPTSDSIGETV